MSARAERRAMIALAAIFALLVQVLAPVSAMAMAMAPDGSALCAPQGAKAVPTDPAPTPDLPAGQCGHCGHCVAAPAVAALPAPLAQPAAVVRYAERLDPPRARAERRPPARAPPRPPGQGPPLPNA
ncbi:MAG TPA: DUF2946 family protein [Phenylobacterium sp.]|nr:DUF2946 family protein [Phenylobacterium sp.]